MRSGDELYMSIKFLEAYFKNFHNADVEDLPAEVVTMLCAFTAMNPESRKLFLQHASDSFCMRCGEKPECWCWGDPDEL